MTTIRSTNPLPRYYFLFAHLSLGAAGLLLALEPSTYAQFFYQPRTVALVHLVTLGWITGSIFGALYMIAPMALRARLTEKHVDRVIFWIYVVAVSIMVVHLGLDSYGGVVWGALVAISAAVAIGIRFLRPVAGARIAAGARLHIVLAFVNVVAAAALGLLLATNKSIGWPGFAGLSGVYAHVHLAALGWAALLVLGVAYRLLPMVLPSKPPAGAVPVLGALVLEAATLGLVGGLLFLPGSVPTFALLAVLGFLLFASQLVLMLRDRRPRAKHLPRFDLALVHLALALVYLLAAITVGLGLVFAWFPEADSPRWQSAYGVLALVGFLAQMVVGMSVRLWPLYAWFRSKDRFPDRVESLPGPSALPSSILSGVVALSWLLLVPLLTMGFFWEQASALRAAGWLLVVAAATSVGHQTLQLRRCTPRAAGS